MGSICQETIVIEPDYVDIDKKLSEFFLQEQEVAFQYGVNDCSSFASDWVKIFIDRTVVEEWPVYSDEPEAITALGDMGYTSQEEMLDHYFTRLKTKRRMMRGDLAGHYFPGYNLMAIGVNAGNMVMFRGAKGIVQVPYANIDDALCWRVG